MPELSKRIIEIADFAFVNIDKTREDIVSIFSQKWQNSPRTIDRYLREAKKYNKTRLKEQEKVKGKVLIKQAKKVAEKGYNDRNKYIAILDKIAEGKIREVSGEIIIPSDRERISAIQQISKMQGWEAPEKKDITTNGNSIGENTIKVHFENYSDGGNIKKN